MPQDNRISETDILNAALEHWPNAAEVHVQFHTHVMGTRLGINREGVCICSVEGSNVRRQFTADTPQALIRRVTENVADWKDHTDVAANPLDLPELNSCEISEDENDS